MLLRIERRAITQNQRYERLTYVLEEVLSALLASSRAVEGEPGAVSV